MRKFMQLLMASTALAMIAGVASASNFIDIDVGGSTNPGTVKTLAITQDNTNATNTVSATGGNTAGGGSFAVNGPWHAITIGQTSGTHAGNILSGSISSGVASDEADNSFTATYATHATKAGNNVHSLAIDGGTVVASIGVTNTGTNTLTPDNTITDKLTASGAISYTLSLDGSGNNVTNTIGQTTPVTSITLGVAATGDGNNITNISDGTGAKTISVALLSGGNTVSNSLTGTGDQSSTLTGDAATKVNYTMASTAGGTMANVTLTGVVGALTAPAVVNVSQSGAGDSALLTVNGGSTPYTMGIGVGTSGLAGVQVTQVSQNAYLNATVTAAANGYTASIHQ